jgi:hypothetical protein
VDTSGPWRPDQGEWIESNHFFCVAVHASIRCLNLDGPGFLLGPKGLTRVRVTLSVVRGGDNKP